MQKPSKFWRSGHKAVESSFDVYWDKLESKLGEWVKSTLPGLVKSIMESYVISIIDEYVSSNNFQRSLADRAESINFDAAEINDRLGVSERTLEGLIDANQSKLGELDEVITQLKEKLQAIAKRVDTLPVIGYILDTRHCIACRPRSPPYQCCTKFAMTFNQATLNIERGRGGGGGGARRVLHCAMTFYSVLFAGKMLRVYQPFCNWL